MASKDPRTYKFGIYDNVRRFPNSYFEAMFEVPGGMEQTTIYVPFSSFVSRFGGFTTWWLEYFWPMDTSVIRQIGYKYAAFDRISYFFLMIIPVQNYEEGYFEMHFKSI